MKKVILLTALCFAFFFTVKAQEAKFTVSVSTDSILMDNYFEVKFTLENINSQNFEAPSFRDFDIVSGPNMSTSISMMNGSSTQSVTYSYYLQPKDIGNYYIQPASVKTGDTYLETEPIEVSVVPNPDGIIQKPQQPNQQRNPFGDFDSFFNNDSFFNDFFNNSGEQLKEGQEKMQKELERMQKELEKKQETKPKKKRKTYKI